MDRRHALRIVAGAALALVVGCGRRPVEVAAPVEAARYRPAPAPRRLRGVRGDPPERPDVDLTPDFHRLPDPPEVAASAPEPDPEPDPPAEPEPQPAPEPADRPDPEPDPAPDPAQVRVEVLCRDAVGLAAAGSGGRPHSITRLTVHHTAVALDHNRQAPGRLRGHQRYHMDQGWPDIAYHYAVDLAGSTYELRDVGLAGDTFTDYDPAGHFLVVCEGNYDQQLPTDAMLRGVAELLAWGAARFGVSLDTVGGHRDYASTTCPGSHLHARLPDLRAEAAAVLGAGVEHRHVCGSEAASRVAAIES